MGLGDREIDARDYGGTRRQVVRFDAIGEAWGLVRQQWGAWTLAVLVVILALSDSSASTADVVAAWPWVRKRSANVVSKMALAVATPMAMIRPTNDWMLSVVFVISNRIAAPAITAGTVESEAKASRTD